MIIPEEVGSKYRFIILAGQRVAQLQKGAVPRVDPSEGRKLTQIALEELSDGKIKFLKIVEKEEETSGDDETVGDSIIEAAKALAEKKEKSA